MKKCKENIKESLKLTTLGFTLVELLAVIVILAIILVIAVPKVMDIINDAKKGTLESTVKMIASAAEKAKVQNTLLGKTENIQCEDIVKLNDVDYASCSISFDSNGKAQVTIAGKGKFAGLNVCGGTKTNATVTEEECPLVCKINEIAAIDSANPVLPYVVKNYDSCVSYTREVFEYDFGDVSELEKLCNGEGIWEYTFNTYIARLVSNDFYTGEELISNNVIASDSVIEPNITLGDYDSCVSYTKEVFVDDWGYSDEEHQAFCSGEDVDGWTYSAYIQDMVNSGIYTKEELIQNNVVGEDSIFMNFKPGNQTSCANYTRSIYVEEWGNSEEELQTLCSGKSDFYTFDNYIKELIVNHNYTEGELIENNVIEGSILKKCAPLSAVSRIKYEFNNNASKNGLIVDNTDDANIRYAGSYDDVKNYVEFGNTNDVWRIIGIFEMKTSDGNTEELVKLVSHDYIGNMSWDSSGTMTNTGNGVNDWSQADLKTMLNTYYIGEANATCTYCNRANQATCTNSCNERVTPINSTYENMIEEVKWATGAIEYSSTLTPLQAYNAERGSTNGKICNQNSLCNDGVIRTIEWEGKVGLIYPSDFGYAGGSTCTSITGSTCGTTNWLHGNYWTLSPSANSDNATSVWEVSYSGGVGSFGGTSTSGVRPALYLKSNVQIIDGDGSRGNPYKLKLG